ncbi:MAG: RHS repeat protein [Theionarchaea archaeon]|nr:RHS repeat protein [Theionarchaea archaeon]
MYGFHTNWYTYSLRDQLESIQNYASFTYFPNGNLAQILFSNGVTTDFQYDSRGRIQNIYAYTDADLLDLTYTHDPAGNITEIENNFLTANQEWITSAETYMYDKSDRLISAPNGFGTISCTYDSKKRLSVTENGQSTSYVYDYDLLLSAGQQTFTYDSNGNTLTKSSEFEWAYHYDNANRLTQVDKDGQIFGQYIYDGDNRRIKKTEWSEDQQDHTTTIYIYSGSNIIYEENMTGTAIHVYGPSGRVAKRTAINNNKLLYLRIYFQSMS